MNRKRFNSPEKLLKYQQGDSQGEAEKQKAEADSGVREISISEMFTSYLFPAEMYRYRASSYSHHFLKRCFAGGTVFYCQKKKSILKAPA